VRVRRFHLERAFAIVECDCDLVSFPSAAFPRSLVDRMTVTMLVTFVCVCTVIGQLRINPFM